MTPASFDNREAGVAVIGTGFMGHAHARAFQAVAPTFPVRRRPVLRAIADLDRTAAERAAAQLGAARAGDDWRAAALADDVEVVAITTPNGLHREMAIAALEAGKAVFCEKPLAANLTDARAMAAAAEHAGAATLTGFNYLANPAIIHARRLIDSGALGEIFDARFVFDEDYMADPTVPHSWRCRRDMAGAGSLGDLGAHAISLALYLVGEIAEVAGTTRTPIGHRPTPDGRTVPVENDDSAAAVLRFAHGATATFACSRIASGRKCALRCEVFGTEGTLAFDQECFNELQVHFRAEDGPNAGFRRVLSGPAHPPYGAFVPAAGAQLGFGDLKTIEVYRLLQALDGAGQAYPDFAFGCAVDAVIDALVRAAETGTWTRVDDRIRPPAPPSPDAEWSALPQAKAHQ